jgi:hypothetical protein
MSLADSHEETARQAMLAFSAFREELAVRALIEHPISELEWRETPHPWWSSELWHVGAEPKALGRVWLDTEGNIAIHVCWYGDVVR